MNIFNINWKNKKVIVINLNTTLKSNKNISNDNYCINYYNDEIISINIFDNTFTNKYELGCLYPTIEILNEIKNLTSIDLSKYNHNPNIVIAQILKTEPIQNTHLQKCLVDINAQHLEIVCGASNARTGLLTIAALDNAIIPTGKLIKNGKLLGNTSNGMLCSWKELGIDNQQNGIIELDNSYQNQIGNPFKLIYKNIN